MNTIKKLLFSISTLAVLLFSACKKSEKDVIPEDGNIANVNFDCLMEVLKQNYGAAATIDLAWDKAHFIYINDSIPYGNFLRFPRFAGAPEQDRFVFPYGPASSSESTPDLSYGEGDTRFERLFWMPLRAEQYRFIFANGHKSYLADTTFTLAKGTFTQLYLVENPKQDFNYTVVRVPVEKRSVEGAVSIQAVNLSPDLGPVDLIRTDKDGNEISQKLPKALDFGQIPSLATISAQESVDNDKLIFLKFRKSNTGEIVQAVAVPALPGSAFTVVLHGFAAETRRYYRLRDDNYGMVTLSANLRVKLRRTN